VRSLRFLAAALAEYDRAVEWHAERSPEAAAEFVATVERTLARIRELPGVAQEWPGRPELRRQLLGRFPYSIIYLLRDDDDGVVILAMAHTSRTPGYWLGRLRR
jgi:plasmid stabilization system protein ParE